MATPTKTTTECTPIVMHRHAMVIGRKKAKANKKVLVEAAAVTKMGDTLIPDFPDELEGEVLNKVEDRMVSQALPVLLLDARPHKSPGNPKDHGRQCLNFLVTSGDPAGAAQCSVNLDVRWLLGFKYAEQMRAGELLVEAESFDGLDDFAIARLCG